MTLADHVLTYATFKRATGLAFREQERLLASFARHAEARGERCVRVETCLDWASQSASPHKNNSGCTSSAGWQPTCMPRTNATRCPTAMHSVARGITARRRGSCRWSRSAKSWMRRWICLPPAPSPP